MEFEEVQAARVDAKVAPSRSNLIQHDAFLGAFCPPNRFWRDDPEVQMCLEEQAIQEAELFLKFVGPLNDELHLIAIPRVRSIDRQPQ